MSSSNLRRLNAPKADRMGDSRALPQSDDRTSEVRPRRLQPHDPDTKSSGVGLHGQRPERTLSIGSAGGAPNASRVFSGSWRRKVSSRLSSSFSDSTLGVFVLRRALRAPP